MIIYQSTKQGFIEDVEQKRLLGRLEDSFRVRTGSVPADRRQWESTYSDLAWDLKEARIDADVPVAIEYHLTSAGRLRVDAIVAGRNDTSDRVLIIEMKGWEDAESTEIPETVVTCLRGGQVFVLHPSAQALGYRDFIVNFNEDFQRESIDVQACAYLHRLRRRDPEPLDAPNYQALTAAAPLFTLDQRSSLRRHLERLVPRRPTRDLLWLLENGRLRPSRFLADSVAAMLDGNDAFTLVDEQRTAFNVIWHHLSSAHHSRQRFAFIVRGGPGTGKSVIAVRLLSELYRRGIAAGFVAPNQAFRETLREHLSRSRPEHRRLAKVLFQSAYSFHDADWSVDHRHEVLVVDEAHRLKSGKVYQYRGSNMVDDMVRSSRVSIFFVDETQQVTWKDCGSPAEIRRCAADHGVAVVELPELTAQFRCNGSSGYASWVDDVLQIRSTANFSSWGGHDYQFEVFDDAADLYEQLKRLNTENRARLIAGYAWDWPSAGRGRGGAMTHIVAGNLRLPWNFDGENWATAEDGIGQVGCVHTCQGVEFDWVGVLIGPDLAYRDGRIIGIPEKRAKTDKSLHGSKSDLESAAGNDVERSRVLERIQMIMRSTYKVLLTRGRRGCFVWAEDAPLRSYLRSRLQLVDANRIHRLGPVQRAAEPPHEYRS